MGEGEGNAFPMSRFWAIFSTQSISLLGSQIVQFSLVWWLTESSGSAAVLAVASIMALLPQVLFSPIAGALVDRWDRRLIMMVTDTVIALMVVLLAALYAFGLVQIWHIYALLLIRGIGGAFQFPAMQASTTLMVNKDQLSRVAGLNQALQGLVSIAAPAAGALLYDALPLQYVLLVDVATAAIAISTLGVIKIPQPVKVAGESTSLTADIRAGFDYVIHWKGGLWLLFGGIVINLFFVPAASLVPLLVKSYFGGGAADFALMESVLGVGMVSGGLLLGVWGGFKSKVKTALLSMIVTGCGAAAIAFIPRSGFLIAVALYGLVGLMLPFVNGSIFAIIQSLVPPEMQGRIMTITVAVCSAMAPIGLAFAGPVADAFGIQIWFALGGGAMALFGATALLIPSLRQMEQEKTSTAPENPPKND